MNTEIAISDMLAGKMAEDDMRAFLTALADRGETVDDIVGAARALRKHVTGLVAPGDAIDCCGTGGSQRHTLNVSTAVALVVAGCGVPVAKHGNRSHSNPSGAADVLEALNIPLDVPFNKLEEALDDIGFCFLMAPLHHRAMAHVSAVRKSIGRRTIFNLLGPLVNPAHVRKQLVGVSDVKWVEPIAQALKKLGTQAACVVHSEGLDEITLSGPTYVARLKDGEITTATIAPDDFDLPYYGHDDIKGGDAAYNAKALMRLLENHHSPYYDTVLANAAAALRVADNVPDLKSGVAKARDAIEDGRALDILNDYRKAVS